MTQWRTQTATFVQDNPIDASADSFQQGLFIGKDGTKLYHLDENDKVYEYDMSTYDISTMSLLQSFDVSAQELSPRSVWFTPDGLTMFILGSFRVYEYNLSTAWNVTTAVFGQQKTILQDTSHQSIFFRADGLLMFTVGVGSSTEGSSDRVYKYELSTPYDISTITFNTLTGSFHVSENLATGIFFEDNGLRMFVLGATDTFLSTDSTMWEYPLTIPWSINSTLAPTELDLEAHDTTPFGVYFLQTPPKNAGARFWHGGRENDNIYEWTMAQIGVEEEYTVNAILTLEFIEIEVNALVRNRFEKESFIGARLVFFCDTIPNDTGWITNTGQILVDDPLFPNVIRLNQLTGGGGTIERFTRKDIGRTLDGDIKLEFKFDFIDNSTVFPNISASAIINFQENPVHPETTPGNLIGITLTRTVETGQILLGRVDDGTSVVIASNGGSLNQHTPHVYKTNGGADPTIKGPYFVTIELKDGRLRTSLFKDKERTQHFRGSPIDVDATGIIPTMLRYITISNGKGSGDSRQLTAEIDDIYVTQNEPLPVIPPKVSPANGRFEEDWETYSLGDQNPTPWFSNTDIDNGQTPLIEIREVSDENPDTGTKAFKLHTQFINTSTSTSKGRSSVTRLIDAIPTEDGSGLDVATSLSARLNAIILEGDPLGSSAGVVVQFLPIQGSPSGSAVMAFKLFGNGGLELWTGTSWVTDTSLRINEVNLLGTYTGFDSIDLKALFDSDSFISNTLGLDFESHVIGFRIAYAGKSTSVTIGQNTENLINGDFISLLEEGTKQIKPKVNALLKVVDKEHEFKVSAEIVLPPNVFQFEIKAGKLLKALGDNGDCDKQRKCSEINAIIVLREDDLFFSSTHLQDITPIFSTASPLIQEHEFRVTAKVVIRQTQNGFDVSKLIQARDQEHEFKVQAILKDFDKEHEFRTNALLGNIGQVKPVISKLLKAFDQEHEFIINALIGEVNIVEPRVNALLKASGDNGFCTLGQGTLQFCSQTDALIQQQGIITPESEPIVDAILVITIIATEEEFEVSAVLGLSEFESILDVESVIGSKTGSQT